MNGCVYCTKDNECELWTDDKHKSFCDPDCKDKHPSNADRIRAMSDEELSVFLERVADGCDSCPILEECSYTDGEVPEEQVRLKWLKQEYNE